MYVLRERGECTYMLPSKFTAPTPVYLLSFVYRASTSEIKHRKRTEETRLGDISERRLTGRFVAVFVRQHQQP